MLRIDLLRGIVRILATVLGAMYENGEGVPKDRQQAVDWYRKAAALGEQHAQQALTKLGVSP